MFSSKKEIMSQTSVKCGTEHSLLPLEYEAEQPTFPEGYKVKQEAAVTVSSVSISQASESSTNSPRSPILAWEGERGDEART